jgi:hypothetical protein
MRGSSGAQSLLNVARWVARAMTAEELRGFWAENFDAFGAEKWVFGETKWFEGKITHFSHNWHTFVTYLSHISHKSCKTCSQSPTNHSKILQNLLSSPRHFHSLEVSIRATNKCKNSTQTSLKTDSVQTTAEFLLSDFFSSSRFLLLLKDAH